MLQKASTVGILQWVGGGKGRVAEDVILERGQGKPHGKSRTGSGFKLRLLETFKKYLDHLKFIS